MPHNNALIDAQTRDAEDPLHRFRDAFHLPISPITQQSATYLCGHSLGLQPKETQTHIQQELDDWAQLAVEGHLHARRPWFSYHRQFDTMAKLVGAMPEEVVVMNTLSVNLHLMMAGFYKPQGSRCCILYEEGAFPSDLYAFQTQAQWHGYKPEEVLIPVRGENPHGWITTEEWQAAITRHGETVALVIPAGIQYYTGQWMDIPAITAAAHRVGAYCGWDLAHAAGNVPLDLHAWNVDFAIWCTYKYLNGGPGAPGAIFVHQKHHHQNHLRLGGWWGVSEEDRFQMAPHFKPMEGAAGWQLSTAQVLGMAALHSTFQLFDDAGGMSALRRKSIQLTQWFESLIQSIPEVDIITANDPQQRGCQLSIALQKNGYEVFKHLKNQGIIVDWRAPAVIRLAPVPFYNTFEEGVRFALALEKAIHETQ